MTVEIETISVVFNAKSVLFELKILLIIEILIILKTCLKSEKNGAKTRL